MICERGGCPGSGGNQPSPVYPFLMLVVFVALFAVARHFGWVGH